jgi:hypothetical protein
MTLEEATRIVDVMQRKMEDLENFTKTVKDYSGLYEATLKLASIVDIIKKQSGFLNHAEYGMPLYKRGYDVVSRLLNISKELMLLKQSLEPNTMN